MRLFIASLSFVAAFSTGVVAADAPRSCMDLAAAKMLAAAHGARWIEATPEQWQFLRGIYAMNPATPAGLPFGDKAALVMPQGAGDGGVAFFIDGDKACTPMPFPHELGQLLLDVATGQLNHEGSKL